MHLAGDTNYMTNLFTNKKSYLSTVQLEQHIIVLSLAWGKYDNARLSELDAWKTVPATVTLLNHKRLNIKYVLPVR